MEPTRPRLSLPALVLIPLLVAAGCGGGGGEDDRSGQTTAETVPSTLATAGATVSEDEVRDGDLDEDVDLEEVGDSGVTGRVEVRGSGGDDLEVSIDLDDDDERRAVVVSLDSCRQVAKDGTGSGEGIVESTYELPDIEGGSLDAKVELPESMVDKGSYSLVVHEDDSPESDPAGCAGIRVT